MKRVYLVTLFCMLVHLSSSQVVYAKAAKIYPGPNANNQGRSLCGPNEYPIRQPVPFEMKGLEKGIIWEFASKVSFAESGVIIEIFKKGDLLWRFTREYKNPKNPGQLYTMTTTRNVLFRWIKTEIEMEVFVLNFALGNLQMSYLPAKHSSNEKGFFLLDAFPENEEFMQFIIQLNSPVNFNGYLFI